MYKVAKASEYLVITGLGISDIKLAKKSWVFPGQSCTVLDLSPVNYTFNKVQAMSAEKLIFQLIAVFTIGPKVDDKQSLLKYAKIFSSHKKLSDLVQGIVEGETRVLAASMAMEEIFRGTKEFKQQVFEKVQLELNQFGLLIYNANVKQLFDVSGHQYLNYLGKKTQTEAANQAKVDEAEAKMKGDMEEKLIEGKTKQYAAMIDAERKVFENKKEAEVEEANSELAKKKAALAQAAQVAEVEAGKAVALREAELQREVEKIYTLTTTEKRKTELLSKASLDYETKVQEANWELYKKQKAAEAALFEKEKEAEAKTALAEAELFAKEEEAKGLVALGQAQGAYLKALLDAMGGNYADVKDFLMLNRGLPNGNAPQLQMANTNYPIALTPKLQNANAALLQSQMINVQSAQMANRDALLRSQMARINNMNNNNTNLNGLLRLQPSNNGNNGVEANKAVAAVPSPTQIGTLQPNKSS